MGEIDTIEALKPTIAGMMRKQSKYNGPQIDDYRIYHPKDGNQFDTEYGSLVFVMTPIGETFIFKVTEKRFSEGYRIKILD